MSIKNFLLNFIFVGMTLVVSAESALAVKRLDYSISKSPTTNLIKESTSLKLTKEAADESVQQLNPPSDLFITVLGGVTQPTSLSVDSHGHRVNYDFNRQIPLASVQLSHFLFNKGGKWGWAASAGYSYSEYRTTQTTALHIVPVEVNLVYRGEWKSTQKFMPFVMAGPASWIYFQRGLDEYNTSQALWIATATAGVSVNLNRLGWVHSRNDTEIVLQYQRSFSDNSGKSDLNGNTIQLGGTLAL